MRNVTYFQDDILIFARSKEERDRVLKKVLVMLRDNGLTVKREKCKFAVRGVWTTWVTGWMSTAYHQK